MQSKELTAKYAALAAAMATTDDIDVATERASRINYW